MSAMGAIGNIAFVMGLVQVSQRLGLDETPERIMYLRIAFGVAQAVVLLLLFGLKSKINAKNEKTPVTYTPSPSPGQATETKTVTTRDYDLIQQNASVKQHLISLALITVLHLYFGMVQPLFLQIFMPIKTLVTSPLFQIHYLGWEATESRKRPFPTPSPFGVPQADPAADKQDAKKETKKTK
ncbi:hypothetical protein GGF31_003071 [Allomyces arbusculus]|nr:hypothetical protein GGF31_003071 [Allomyces arbusculus]